MANTISIRQLIGAIQEELTILLKVTRRKLSMDEFRKRNLSVQAKLQ